jgi:hypothetical protein
MDPSRARIILPTNATSAGNFLANTTPTAIIRDTVIQTNREGEPPEYREIKTTEKILQPTLLEYAPPPDMTTGTKTTTTTTTTVEKVPKVFIPNTNTTTTVVEEVPVLADYVIASAGAFKPVSVISASTSANSATNQVVETIFTEPVTKKVIKTTETIETTK